MAVIMAIIILDRIFPIKYISTFSVNKIEWFWNLDFQVALTPTLIWQPVCQRWLANRLQYGQDGCSI